MPERSLGQRSSSAGRRVAHVEHPDVVAAAAIGRESDSRAVVRPPRLAIIESARSSAAWRRCRRIEPTRCSNRFRRTLERDLATVGGEARLLPFDQQAGREPPRRAAAHRHAPQRSKNVDDERPPVGRRCACEVGAFSDGDSARGAVGRVAALRDGAATSRQRGAGGHERKQSEASRFLAAMGGEFCHRLAEMANARPVAVRAWPLSPVFRAS